MNYKTIHYTSSIIAAVAALSWALAALFNFHWVELLRQSYPFIGTLIFALFGVSGAIVLWNAFCSLIDSGDKY